MGFKAIFRLFTNREGKSQVEELDLASHPKPAEATTTQHIFFRQWEADHFIDRHPAPRRQYILSLSGLVDGTTHRFLPGDARLVEDTTGNGHTTLVPQGGPAVTAVIPLA